MKYVDTEKLRKDIVSSIDNALSKMEYQYEKFGEKATETKEKTQRFVRENPEKSVLIAAGIGALAAVIALKVIKKKMMRTHNYEPCC